MIVIAGGTGTLGTRLVPYLTAQGHTVRVLTHVAVCDVRDQRMMAAAAVRADPGHLLLAFSRWTCVRARFAEDAVERAAVGGVGQYVILGAGLDSFAYRRDDLLGRLQVFEVDHPATQSWKRRRLAARRWASARPGVRSGGL